MAGVFSEAIHYAYNYQSGCDANEKRQLVEDIKTTQGSLAKAKEWLYAGRIQPEDFAEMKSEMTTLLEKQQNKLECYASEIVDLKGLVGKGISNLLGLANAYQNGTLEERRVIIGSVYPEKFSISENHVRTTRLNKAVELIYTLGAGFSGNKNGTNSEKSDLSRYVGLTGQFTNRFVRDLKQLARLSQASY